MRSKLLLLIICTLLGSACATLAGRFIPPQKSKHDASTWKYSPEVLQDKVVDNYVDQIALKLIKYVPQANLAYKKLVVTVGKTSLIQSMSGIGNNRIGVSRGMLNVLINEDELACLLGHEIGHKVLRGQRYQSKARMEDILLSDDMKKAAWNRKGEQDADAYGSALCGQAGYDPYALVDLFERLAQFQESGFWASVREQSATHKDFLNRARDLRVFLARQGLTQQSTKHQKINYVKSLASIKSFRSHDAVSELVPGGAASDIQHLRELKAQLVTLEKTHTTLSTDRFLQIMDELSRIGSRYGVRTFATDPQATSHPFMKEIISQDTPLWDDQNIQQEINDVLATLGRLGIGFIPVIGDAVDLYELLTGVEFGTGQNLDFKDRVMTAAGLLAGSGKMWREVASGVGQTFKESQVIRLVGRSSINEGESALKQALRDGIYERAMSKSELVETQRTGLLRGGRGDIHYFGSNISNDAKKTHRRLGLDGNLRDVKVKFRFKNETEIIGPARVSPVHNKPGTGGGLEFTAEGQIEIDIVDVTQLRK